MKKQLVRITTLILLALITAVSASCAKPLSAEETEQQREYFEEKYASQPAPSEQVQRVLDLLDTCVGGQYIFGAQGHEITTDYVSQVYNMYESYFGEGRYEYFMDIASEGETDGFQYPYNYAWDCSGLWWYCSDELGLYDKGTDMTASGTYYTICTPITKDELRPGDLVFVEDEEGKIVHMGIVGTHGYIYEAVSSFVGVVEKRTIDRRVYDDIVRGGAIEYGEWNVFGRPVIFE